MPQVCGLGRILLEKHVHCTEQTREPHKGRPRDMSEDAGILVVERSPHVCRMSLGLLENPPEQRSRPRGREQRSLKLHDDLQAS